MSEWTGLNFCVALREAENKIKWREKVLGSWRPNGHHDYGIGAGATKAKFALDRIALPRQENQGSFRFLGKCPQPPPPSLEIK